MERSGGGCADYPFMAMEAEITVLGSPLDIQHFVRLVEGENEGKPVVGTPNSWEWRSEHEDIVDRVIAHSMEFPDLEVSVVGATVADGDFREDVWCWVQNGSGRYERHDFGGRVNHHLPLEMVYDSIRYEHRLTAGKAALARAVIFTDIGTLDVTHYLR